MKWILLFLGFLVIPTALAQVLCYDDGSIFVKTNIDRDVKARTNVSSSFFNVTGKWEGSNDLGFSFKSDEAIFNLPYDNNIIVQYPQFQLATENEGTAQEIIYIEKEVQCPAFIYSCRFMDFSIERCYQEGQHKVIMFKTTKLDSLTELDFRVFTKTGKIFSFGKDVTTKNIQNLTYYDDYLEFNSDLEIKNIEVNDPRCTGSYYFEVEHVCNDTKTVEVVEPEPIVEPIVQEPEPQKVIVEKKQGIWDRIVDFIINLFS